MTIVMIILWFFGCVAVASIFMGSERLRISSVVAGCLAGVILVVPFVVGVAGGFLVGGVALAVCFFGAKGLARLVKQKRSDLHLCPKCGSPNLMDTSQFKGEAKGFLVCNDCKHQFSHTEGVWLGE